MTPLICHNLLKTLLEEEMLWPKRTRYSFKTLIRGQIYFIFSVVLASYLKDGVPVTRASWLWLPD